MRLQGKTALITGGGSGIGRAIAAAFAREGCRVAIAGRTADKLAEAAAHAAQMAAPQAPHVETHTVDVADRKSVAELFAWTRKTLGPLDILVNNSGVNVPKRFMANLDPADWDRMIAINATGAYNCLREALPEMRERKSGLVINVVSTSGKRASLLGGVGYNASKFAMMALGTSVSLEDGKNGIRVTSICPGEVDTPILEHRPSPITAEHRARILQPEDVAEVALMVACLPARANVPEVIIKPTSQDYT